MSRLILTGRDCGEAGADDLDRKGGAVDRQAQYPCGQGIDRNAVQRQNEEQDVEDDEQRNITNHLDIDGGDAAREAVVRKPQQGADEAEREAQGDGEGADLQGSQCAPTEHRQIGDQHPQIEIGEPHGAVTRSVRREPGLPLAAAHAPLHMASTWPASSAAIVSALPENSTIVAFGAYVAMAFAAVEPRAIAILTSDLLKSASEPGSLRSVRPIKVNTSVRYGSVKPTDFSRSRFGVKDAIVMSAFLVCSMATRPAVSVLMYSMVTASCFANKVAMSMS